MLTKKKEMQRNSRDHQRVNKPTPESPSPTRLSQAQQQTLHIQNFNKCTGKWCIQRAKYPKSLKLARFVLKHFAMNTHKDFVTFTDLQGADSNLYCDCCRRSKVSLFQDEMTKIM